MQRFLQRWNRPSLIHSSFTNSMKWMRQKSSRRFRKNVSVENANDAPAIFTERITVTTRSSAYTNVTRFKGDRKPSISVPGHFAFAYAAERCFIA